MSGMLFVLSGAAYGTTYYVAPNGVDDPCYGLDPCTPFATIQYGINATSNGDVVNVSEGTYYENIDFDGKGITVTSSNPSDWDIVAATVIDACDVGNVVEFTSGEDANSVITGFTVKNGGNYIIKCGNSSSPIIRYCIIEESGVHGIYCYTSSSPLITNNIIRENDSAGVFYAAYSAPTIKNNLIYGNSYGILAATGGSATIRNNTIVGNTTGGIKNVVGTAPTTSNCILWENGDDLYNCSATYSCIEDGDAGTGNISSYPYFNDFENDDFRLTWNSPCINRGDPCVSGEGETDIDGESRGADGRIDMGADELEFYASDTCNLVQNPCFESGGRGKYWNGDPCNTVPLYWENYWPGTKDPNAQTTIDSSAYYGPEGHSWRMSCTGIVPYGEVAGRSDYISVKSNTYYALSCYSKCANGDEGISYRTTEYYINDANEITYNNQENSTIVSYPSLNWTQYWKFFVTKDNTDYVKIKLFGPRNYHTGKVWWDDICLQEFYPHEEYAPAYGCIKNTSGVISIDFGSGDPCESLVQGTITDYMSAPANDDSDPCNINYRSLLSGETLVIEFPAFNVDEDGFPLSPMLIEIMYKDNINSAGSVILQSKIDYIKLDPCYITDSEDSPDPNDRDIRLAYLGGRNDDEWKYMQYAFQKSDFQLLRAIGGVFTIKINNDASNIPIDYISLRTISDEEYADWCEVQRSSKGFYEAELPDDSPENPNYGDPCMVIFVRDVMRPVYQHTQPDPCEIDQDVEGFGTWGEIEPLSFSIYSLNGISDLSFTVSNLEHKTEDACIPAVNISLYQVVYAERRLGYNDLRTFALVPDRLEEFTTLSIDRNSSKRIWLKVQVPYEDEDLPAGLYEGNVTIKKDGVTQNTVKVKFTIYDITLAWPDCVNAVYSDPFSDVYSIDLDKICQAYRETGFDMFIKSRSHRITATGSDANDITFDTTNFKASLDRMIEEGLVGDKVVVSIPTDLRYEVFKIVYGTNNMTGDPCLYWKLSDPCFSQAFGALIEEYQEIGNSYDPNVVFIFEIIDEPGNDFGAGIRGYKRILTDRLCNIIHDRGGKTYAAYSSYCDVVLKPDKLNYNVSHPDNPYDPCLGPLTDVIDYKTWNRMDIGLGYEKHSDPCYFGSFGFYTTGLSHMDNPVYNRFLHGLFAFGSDSSTVAAYSMGFYVSDPYNDFDSAYYQVHPQTHPDFLYAYPTWSGELLSTIGGLEAIREGIKDAKYIATLQYLLPDDPCSWTSLQQEAHDYLESIKSRINPDYDIGYVKQMTELGYYEAILDDLTDPCNPLTNDYEAFSRIRAKLVEYIIGNYQVHNLTQNTWHPTIQAGINRAEANNVIEILPGIYYENIDFLGKAITLRSTDPGDPCVVETTIIDGGNQDNVVEFVNGEGDGSVMSGFTIRNGSDYGIYSYSTSPLISNCIIEDNARGIHISGSGAAPHIYQNKIRDNTYGVFPSTYSEPILTSNWIYNNTYGVRFYLSSSALLRNNTIVGNTYGVTCYSGSQYSISNCILWENGDDLYNCSATYSCIEDYDPCTGNIHCDPCFVDAANNDYHLREVSPCIEAGDPCFVGDPCEVDIDGDSRVLNVRVDIGADEFDRLEDPLAHWQFDETSGTTAYDTTGTYNGTLQGDPCWIDGYLDGALNFDGTDDYVSFAGTLGVGSDSFTACAWIKAGQARSQHRGIFRFASGSGTEVNIYLAQSSGKLRIYDYTTYKDSTIALDDGSWHHIAVVRDGEDDLKVYIDGQLNVEDEDYFSGTTLKNLTSVGYRDGYRYFDGYIDDPRIYGFALNADEVECLYNIE